ncbi:MAG: hypothetical protein PHY48_09040 [Candidatus Cloacimonetes bacterium]|nr:hypothetical protein [Candidatus Cloacimonadota bacterium]
MQRQVCPRCSSKDVLPIEYGYPGIEMMEDSENGKIVLGGCCVSDNDPTRECQKCKHRFAFINNIKNGN